MFYCENIPVYGRDTEGCRRQPITVASDLAERLRAAKEPGYRGGIPECLVAIDRKTVPLGLGYVDDTDAIARNLANEIYPKAFRMITLY